MLSLFSWPLSSPSDASYSGYSNRRTNEMHHYPWIKSQVFGVLDNFGCFLAVCWNGQNAQGPRSHQGAPCWKKKKKKAMLMKLIDWTDTGCVWWDQGAPRRVDSAPGWPSSRCLRKAFGAPDTPHFHKKAAPKQHFARPPKKLESALNKAPVVFRHFNAQTLLLSLKEWGQHVKTSEAWDTDKRCGLWGKHHPVFVSALVALLRLQSDLQQSHHFHFPDNTSGRSFGRYCRQMNSTDADFSKIKCLGWY